MQGLGRSSGGGGLIIRRLMVGCKVGLHGDGVGDGVAALGAEPVPFASMSMDPCIFRGFSAITGKLQDEVLGCFAMP